MKIINFRFADDPDLTHSVRFQIRGPEHLQFAITYIKSEIFLQSRSPNGFWNWQIEVRTRNLDLMSYREPDIITVEDLKLWLRTWRNDGEPVDSDPYVELEKNWAARETKVN